MGSHQSDIAERIRFFEAQCRERGLALTVHRRVILETLLARDDHPTADQIFDDVKKRIPDISRTTVYRVLETLVELGVIAKPGRFGHAARFEPNIHQHHHLICTSCGRVADIEDDAAFPDMRPLLGARAAGFAVADYSIHFHGVCASCAQAGGQLVATERHKDDPSQP